MMRGKLTETSPASLIISLELRHLRVATPLNHILPNIDVEFSHRQVKVALGRGWNGNKPSEFIDGDQLHRPEYASILFHCFGVTGKLIGTTEASAASNSKP